MVYRRGKTWWFEFVFMGQRVRESSRSRSKTVAVEAERVRRRELEESVNGLRKKKRRVILFSAATREYLDAKQTAIKASTLRIERKNVDHLLPSFGKMLVQDIDADDIARYQRARATEGAAGATINLEIGTLRGILKKHRLWGALQDDVKKRPERDDVGVALTDEQQQRLLAACQNSRSRSLYPAVVLALNTGLRRSELLGLRWNQIDFSNRTLRVGESKTRSGRGRTIPLNTSAMTILSFWTHRFPTRAHDNALFPSERVGGGRDQFGAVHHGHQQQ